MEYVVGGYTAVILNDGSAGSYTVARQYFRLLNDEQKRRPELFQQACRSVLNDEEGALNLCAQIARWGDAEEVAAVIKLCARETRLSVIFGYVAGKTWQPSYELTSPFLQASKENPLDVAEEHRWMCNYEYTGPINRNPFMTQIRPR